MHTKVVFPHRKRNLFKKLIELFYVGGLIDIKTFYFRVIHHFKIAVKVQVAHHGVEFTVRGRIMYIFYLMILFRCPKQMCKFCFHSHTVLYRLINGFKFCQSCDIFIIVAEIFNLLLCFTAVVIVIFFRQSRTTLIDAQLILCRVIQACTHTKCIRNIHIFK